MQNGLKNWVVNVDTSNKISNAAFYHEHNFRRITELSIYLTARYNNNACFYHYSFGLL